MSRKQTSDVQSFVRVFYRADIHVSGHAVVAAAKTLTVSRWLSISLAPRNVVGRWVLAVTIATDSAMVGLLVVCVKSLVK
jgi:hypothetical protein